MGVDVLIVDDDAGSPAGRRRTFTANTGSLFRRRGNAQSRARALDQRGWSRWGLSNPPTFLTAPRDDHRQFVTERAGRIRAVRDDRVLERPFLDITDRREPAPALGFETAAPATGTSLPADRRRRQEEPS